MFFPLNSKLTFCSGKKLHQSFCPTYFRINWDPAGRHRHPRTARVPAIDSTVSLEFHWDLGRNNQRKHKNSSPKHTFFLGNHTKHCHCYETMPLYSTLFTSQTLHFRAESSTFLHKNSIVCTAVPAAPPITMHLLWQKCRKRRAFTFRSNGDMSSAGLRWDVYCSQAATDILQVHIFT